MTTRRYRGGVRFVANVREHSRLLDPNERARIMMRARVLERETQVKGKPNGLLGWVGLLILHELLFTFHNRKTGLCCPSYDALETATGLCRGSVAAGVARLVAAGILDRTRRLVHAVVDRGGVLLKGVRQGSNLYAMREPPEWAWLIPVSPAKARSFGKPAFAALAKLLGWAESTEQGGTNLKVKKGAWQGEAAARSEPSAYAFT